MFANLSEILITANISQIITQPNCISLFSDLFCPFFKNCFLRYKNCENLKWKLCDRKNNATTDKLYGMWLDAQHVSITNIACFCQRLSVNCSLACHLYHITYGEVKGQLLSTVLIGWDGKMTRMQSILISGVGSVFVTPIVVQQVMENLHIS